MTRFLAQTAPRLLGADTPLSSVLAGMRLAHWHRGGLVQVLSYPFIAEDVFDSELLGEQDMRRKAVRVANPLADDQPYCAPPC